MGPLLLLTDPAGSSQDQAIFWAPEVLPTIIPIVRSTAASNGNVLSLTEMSAGEIRQASDGWHVLLRIRGARASAVAERAAGRRLAVCGRIAVR